ncbi:MAG: hypothetical protein NTY59_09725 [Alphaproteobacteria bacterium]|nr:hypothetical protein [Alphaproteobacteria bacterium]
MIRVVAISTLALATLTSSPGHVAEHPLTEPLLYANWEANYRGIIGCGTPGLYARAELEKAIAKGELPTFFKVPERNIRELDLVEVQQLAEEGKLAPPPFPEFPRPSLWSELLRLFRKSECKFPCGLPPQWDAHNR